MRALQAKPGIYVTYNGDFFDWPFLETRASKHGMDMYEQLSFKKGDNPECLSRAAVHMDCMHWVNRDSYLPQGSRGLKVGRWCRAAVLARCNSACRTSETGCN